MSFLNKKLFSESETLHFNGTSMLVKDLLRDPISAFRETIRFRFKTSMANGLILYSRGTQKDYIALQLQDNRMLLNIDLGIIYNIIFIFILHMFWINKFELT